MKKLDLRKDLKQYYQPSAKKPVIIRIPRFQFAMIDGAIEKGGEPGTSPELRRMVIEWLDATARKYER